MQNCLVLGSGRSGTSMLGGILHEAGYYMGDNLYPGRHSNPKGFFENHEINTLNELILKKYPPFFKKLKNRLQCRSTIYAPGLSQYWLMSIEQSVKIQNCNKKIASRILNLGNKQPFAYKDPRFSYTFPVWLESLPKNSKLVVMFRSPAVTATSILKECSSVGYLSNMEMSYEIALKTWHANIYSYNLQPLKLQRLFSICTLRSNYLWKRLTKTIRVS